MKFEHIQDNDVVAVASCSKQITEHRTFRKIRLDHYKEFSDILRIKCHNKEDEINKIEDYEFDRVVFFGLDKWKKEETGYEIIHKGKKADKRVLKKLGRISFELLQFTTYPKIDASVLRVVLNKALGEMDPRPKRDYRKTVLYYCNIDEQVIDRCSDTRLGELDVSGFVRRVPSSYMVNDSQ